MSEYTLLIYMCMSNIMYLEENNKIKGNSQARERECLSFWCQLKHGFSSELHVLDFKRLFTSNKCSFLKHLPFR